MRWPLTDYLLLELQRFFRSQHVCFLVILLHLLTHTQFNIYVQKRQSKQLVSVDQLTRTSVNSESPNDPRTMKVMKGSPNFRNLLLFAYTCALSSNGDCIARPAVKGQPKKRRFSIYAMGGARECDVITTVSIAT